MLTALPRKEPTETYIVQGASLAQVRSAVDALGGEITHELEIIEAVGARLTARQHATIRASGVVRRLYDNRRVETAKKKPSKNQTPVTSVDASSADTSNNDGGQTGHVTGIEHRQGHASTGDALGMQLVGRDSGDVAGFAAVVVRRIGA